MGKWKQLLICLTILLNLFSCVGGEVKVVTKEEIIHKDRVEIKETITYVDPADIGVAFANLCFEYSGKKINTSGNVSLEFVLNGNQKIELAMNIFPGKVVCKSVNLRDFNSGKNAELKNIAFIQSTLVFQENGVQKTLYGALDYDDLSVTNESLTLNSLVKFNYDEPAPQNSDLILIIEDFLTYGQCQEESGNCDASVNQSRDIDNKDFVSPGIDKKEIQSSSAIQV